MTYQSAERAFWIGTDKPSPRVTTIIRHQPDIAEPPIGVPLPPLTAELFAPPPSASRIPPGLIAAIFFIALLALVVELARLDWAALLEVLQ
ncbi:MAG TPA: hypothetical protein VIH40_11740 [Xanthobacteraceae bacterium]